MAKLTDEPDEILRVGNRKIYVYVHQLEDGKWAVDYEARPLVIEPALSTPLPPRRRSCVEDTREEALKKAKERFRLMYHMRQRSTVNPASLVYH